ncbi:ankyrin repeat-containing domain protein [Flagelloscypha sp. PMI_526]|nr:ankyrin repeat-containing domain protein [Flagelloscypha sp. PMI_526]
MYLFSLELTLHHCPAGSLAAEDGKAWLNAQIEEVCDNVVHIKKAMGSDFYCKMKTWLTPIDQTAKFDSCIRTRTSSTCGWLWDFPRVVEWKNKGGIFWCHAGMGAGKTMIMSYVVETLMKAPDECFVAYYYFEFTNPSTLSEEALFRSLVFQLSHANYAASQRLYEHHRDGSFQPQLSTLHEHLRELVTGAPIPVYIIIDALDELPSPPRKYLIESLLALSSLMANGVHVMATSRDELDIHKAFSGQMSFDFAIEKEMVHNDIAVFVDQALSAEKWTFWPKQQVLRMRNTLIDKADGMFRMVACQIEVLNQTQSTEDLERALASLPATLGDTYLYILNKIPSHLQPRAHTLLCILSTALELVSITELSALVAVELGDPTDPIDLPVYRERMLFHEPQNLIGLGAALVRRTTVNPDSPYAEESLQLSHASVKEYLLQGTCPWYSLNDQLANETTARACLALLIHNEDPKRTSGDVEITYTKYNWRRHMPSNHSAQLLSPQEKLFETFPWPRTSAGRWLRTPPWEMETNQLITSPLLFAVTAGLEQLLIMMLAHSFQWKIEDLNGAMVAASYMGSSTEVFTALIERGGDVNATTKYGTPILQFQTLSHRLYIARILVENGADVNMIGGTYVPALQAAVCAGALDVVKFFVENGADVNMGGGDYGSALQVAAAVGDLDIVKLLVKNGADVNMAGMFYGSALQAAARVGSVDVVKFLIENGADANMGGGFDGSALEGAAAVRALDIVKLLVENGADVNMVGTFYGSALHAAACAGSVDVVKFLIENGADVNIAGGDHGSALQVAAGAKALDIVKLLVKNGADVNMAGTFYGSALQAATRAGSVDVVKFLIENGADVNIAGGDHGSALQVAAGARALEIVKLLVENGADVNMVGTFCGSALHAAASAGALDVVKFLVDNEADVNIAGGEYGSALQAAELGDRRFAYYRARRELISFLTARGAVRLDGTAPLYKELEWEDSSSEYSPDSSDTSDGSDSC